MAVVKNKCLDLLYKAHIFVYAYVVIITFIFIIYFWDNILRPWELLAFCCFHVELFFLDRSHCATVIWSVEVDVCTQWSVMDEWSIYCRLLFEISHSCRDSKYRNVTCIIQVSSGNFGWGIRLYSSRKMRRGFNRSTRWKASEFRTGASTWFPNWNFRRKICRFTRRRARGVITRPNTWQS